MGGVSLPSYYFLLRWLISILIAQVSGISQSTDNSLRRKSDSAPPSICGCSPAEGFDKILQMTPNSLVSLFRPSQWFWSDPATQSFMALKRKCMSCMSEQWLSKKVPSQFLTTAYSLLKGHLSSRCPDWWDQSTDTFLTTRFFAFCFQAIASLTAIATE